MTRWVLLLLVVAACSAPEPDPGPPLDAGSTPPDVDAGSPMPDAGSLALASPAPPIPPAPPAPPLPPAALVPLDFLPCPSGWQVLSSSVSFGGSVCQPYAAPPACTGAEAQFPGDSSCAPIGSACPIGPWPEGLPASTPILYVDPAASPGGDGTQAAPYASARQAVLLAAPGTIVALAKGSYDEGIEMSEGVTLWGACVAESIISRVGSPGAVAVSINVSGAVLRNLQIVGDGPAIWQWHDGASSQLLDVLIARASYIGWLVRGVGNVAAAHNLIIRDMAPGAAGDFGDAINAGDGAQLTLDHVSIERGRSVAVSMNAAGSRLTLRDALIADTQPHVASGTLGRGLFSDQAQVELERVVFSGNRDLSLGLARNQSTLRDVVIQNGLPGSTGYATGLELTGGATLSADRVWIEAAMARGLHVANRGTHATFRGLLVARTVANGDDRKEGRAVYVDSGAELLVDGGALIANREFGLIASDLGTRIELSDTAVRDTESQLSDGYRGIGLATQFQAELVGRRVALIHNRLAGLSAVFHARVTLEDAEVRDTYNHEARFGAEFGGFGQGLLVSDGSQLAVTRASIVRNTACGVEVGSRTSRAELVDVTIAETRPQQSSGNFGRGLCAESGAEVRLLRGRILRNHEIGAMAIKNGARLELRDVEISDTRSRPSDGMLGAGVSVQGGASLYLERGVIEDNRHSGLTVTGTSVLELYDLVVRRTQNDASGELGVGVLGLPTRNFEDGSHITVARVVIEDNLTIGLEIAGAGGRLDAEDLVVRRTTSRVGDKSYGRGLNVENGVVAVLNRVLLEDNQEVGLAVLFAGTELSAHDLVVQRNRANGRGQLGRGVSVLDGAQVLLERVELLDNEEVGLIAQQAGASVTALDLRVRGTRIALCDPCTTPPGGIGVAAFDRGAVMLERFQIVHSEVAGLAVGAEGMLDARSGEVAENAIGLNVEDEGFDLSRVQDMVIFRDNQRNLDGRSLPLPAVTGSIPMN